MRHSLATAATAAAVCCCLLTLTTASAHAPASSFFDASTIRLAPPPLPPGIAATDPSHPPPTPTDDEFKAAGFVKDASGLWTAPDIEDAAHKVVVPQTRADVAALTHALAARRHAWVQAVHGERSIPAMLSFLVAEYQQLVSDTLAVLGLSQPPFESSDLARVVQDRIDELYTVLRSVSPTLAAHVTIQNPIYSNKNITNLGTGETTNTDAWATNTPLFFFRSRQMFGYYQQALTFAPCLITVSATGAEVGARLINVSPRLIEVSVGGAAGNGPKVINISPDLMRIKPVGAQIIARRFNIGPVHLAASPDVVVQDPKLKLPLTEQFGGAKLDFAKHATADKGGPRPSAKDMLAKPAGGPKFDGDFKMYKGQKNLG